MKKSYQDDDLIGYIYPISHNIFIFSHIPGLNLPRQPGGKASRNFFLTLVLISNR